jgi:hypothetical protein
MFSLARSTSITLKLERSARDSEKKRSINHIRHLNVSPRILDKLRHLERHRTPKSSPWKDIASPRMFAKLRHPKITLFCSEHPQSAIALSSFSSA